ncbi:hypothetical protein FKZ61_007245 [Litorilinea aerophila]|uniref:Uncharacterized protein n=1 Tax=Litorilinea aerophila TaxID=1204385 RepID=A0A540VIT6_9CHLR|nr:hypothetical protein [Litorilinea aerophila]MCC9075902.1 hypothetical protein [Litorilinea aerophila]
MDSVESYQVVRKMVKKHAVSNAMLGLGVAILLSFMGLEVTGMSADPLLPAFAAFCIGCTAVLDRIGRDKMQQR